MIETLKNAWKLPDLRKRLLFTAFILLIFRFGSFIPVPFIDTGVLAAKMSESSDTIFGVFNMLSGGAMSQASVFAMSVSPYINASIIIQLLTVAIPALERLAREGLEGRKKLTQISRYTTVAIGLIQGYGFYTIIRSWGAIPSAVNNWFSALVIVLSFTAGCAFIMWLGEQITDKGVGNGISIILFVGIISGIPGGVGTLLANNTNVVLLAGIALVALAAVAFVVFMNESERRIPVQYAKRVVGRKMYGGQSSHIPLKVNMAGVMPIIFASSICSLPSTIIMFFPNLDVNSFWGRVLMTLQPSSIWYGIIYFVLIIFFNYFYIAIQYNPVEMANNMKKNGGFIPGIRPGKPTADFITRTMSKITLMGSFFLGVIAVMPIIFNTGLHVQGLYFGGTSLLIVVGVALETVKQIEAQMLMRNYRGFLE
ncbi:MAG: preprotein translocase subunit SecY [Eubacteriales bacterium]|jgi:preprotein translocase subunit SecY